MYTKVQVVFDAAEPEKLGAFWALALGYVTDQWPPEFATLGDFLTSLGIPEGERWALVDPAGEGPRLYFQRVPEPKTAKNRVHLDVRVPDRAAHVARLVAAGGSVIRELDEPGGHCTVMRDPEGNEFCVA